MVVGGMEALAEDEWGGEGEEEVVGAEGGSLGGGEGREVVSVLGAARRWGQQGDEGGEVMVWSSDLR